MSLYASWAHGTVGVCPVLKPTIDLSSLEYKGHNGEEANVFFPIPTPVIIRGNRSRLQRVFVLYWLDHGVKLGPVSVYDGQNDPGAFDPNSTGQTTFNVHISGPKDVTGVNGFSDLIDNVTQFSFSPEQPLVYFGLTLVVGIKFSASAKARFTAVGADFEA